jgi:FkbM family methyltransferase
MQKRVRNMAYKDVAREKFLELSWPLRRLIRGYKKSDYLGFLQAKGVRFKVVQVNDYRMKVDLKDNVITPSLFVHGCWEPYESQLMATLLRPGMTVIDVGAHVGYYSLLAARAVGSTGRVISFEPSPGNFDLLINNIRLNGLSRIIQAENAALGDVSGELDLYLSSYNTGDHRIYSTLSDDDEIFNAGALRQTVRVPIMTLDEYLGHQDIAKVDMVKIDVQGAEMGVLCGMKQTLLRNPALLLFTEFWPHGLRRCGTEPERLLNFLVDEIGLSLFQILGEEQRLVSIKPASFASQTRDVDPREQIDLLCSASPSAKLLESIS